MRRCVRVALYDRQCSPKAGVEFVLVWKLGCDFCRSVTIEKENYLLPFWEIWYRGLYLIPVSFSYTWTILLLLDAGFLNC